MNMCLRFIEEDSLLHRNHESSRQLVYKEKVGGKKGRQTDSLDDPFPPLCTLSR